MYCYIHYLRTTNTVFPCFIEENKLAKLRILEDTQVEYISQKYTFGKYIFEKYALRYMLYAIRFTPFTFDFSLFTKGDQRLEIRKCDGPTNQQTDMGRC